MLSYIVSFAGSSYLKLITTTLIAKTYTILPTNKTHHTKFTRGLEIEASNEQLSFLSWQVKSEIKFVIYITMARDIWN